MTTKPTPFEIASGMEEAVCAAQSLAHAIRLMAEGLDNAADNNALQRVVIELERYLNEIDEGRAKLFHELSPGRSEVVAIIKNAS
jgi:hypothetical protein